MSEPDARRDARWDVRVIGDAQWSERRRVKKRDGTKVD